MLKYICMGFEQLRDVFHSYQKLYSHTPHQQLMLRTMFLPLLRIYRFPRYLVLPLEKPRCCLMQLPANKPRVLTLSTKFHPQMTMYICFHVLYQQLRISQCYLMRERSIHLKALMSVSKSCPLSFIVIIIIKDG